MNRSWTFKFSDSALIIAIGLIVSSLIVSKFFIRIKHEDTIAVKGYAEKAVKSDIGKFYCSFSVAKSELPKAYDELMEKKERVITFLKENGIKDDELETNNINSYKSFKRDQMGRDTSIIEAYTLTQSILITSKNVNMIKDVSKKVNELIQEGIEIFVQEPQFFISDPKDIKMALIENATQDGYQRAKTMALKSGGKVGSLNSARQGVFQITAPNSTETSDYGMYDTSTIDKVVKVVVNLSYSVEK